MIERTKYKIPTNRSNAILFPVSRYEYFTFILDLESDKARLVPQEITSGMKLFVVATITRLKTTAVEL